MFDSLTTENFTHPGYIAVRTSIAAAGGTAAGLTGAQWIEQVRERRVHPLPPV